MGVLEEILVGGTGNGGPTGTTGRGNRKLGSCCS